MGRMTLQAVGCTALTAAAVACGGGDGPVDGADGGLDRKLLFVTSETFKGDLGGVAGADAKCDDAARAAGLGGAWRAWISVPDDDAIDRIEDVGPWYLPDGDTMVFADRAQLATTPSAPLDQTELGDTVTPMAVWTGTNVGGTSGSSDCAAWTVPIANTGIVGRTDSTSSEWTDDVVNGCIVSIPIYCLGQ